LIDRTLRPYNHLCSIRSCFYCHSYTDAEKTDHINKDKLRKAKLRQTFNFRSNSKKNCDESCYFCSKTINFIKTKVCNTNTDKKQETYKKKGNDANQNLVTHSSKNQPKPEDKSNKPNKQDLTSIQPTKTKSLYPQTTVEHRASTNPPREILLFKIPAIQGPPIRPEVMNFLKTKENTHYDIRQLHKDLYLAGILTFKGQTGFIGGEISMCGWSGKIDDLILDDADYLDDDYEDILDVIRRAVLNNKKVWKFH
jgi:hypothetical protein